MHNVSSTHTLKGPMLGRRSPIESVSLAISPNMLAFIRRGHLNIYRLDFESNHRNAFGAEFGDIRVRCFKDLVLDPGAV